MSDEEKVTREELAAALTSDPALLNDLAEWLIDRAERDCDDCFAASEADDFLDRAKPSRVEARHARWAGPPPKAWTHVEVSQDGVTWEALAMEGIPAPSEDVLLHIPTVIRQMYRFGRRVVRYPDGSPERLQNLWVP
jgi:hypothetical protein